MFKVSVMYPNSPGVKFDFDYYRFSHMKLVEKHMKPFGLLKTVVEKGISGEAGQPPPYVCIGHLYYDKADAYHVGNKEVASLLRADIPNYSNVMPVRQVSEVLE